jgi:hypothetical protein
MPLARRQATFSTFGPYHFITHGGDWPQWPLVMVLPAASGIK